MTSSPINDGVVEISPRTPDVNMDLFAKGFQKLPATLRRLGFESLREGQKETVNAVIGGVDTICVMPTAGGKSLTFIVPTLAHGWRTLVFSPLKSLMRDQVKKLQKAGVAAFDISSDNKPGENSYAMSAWISGECEILYVAPERLRNVEFRNALSIKPPDMVCVDECHVISQWTDSFRSAYTVIAEIIEVYQPRVVMAVTATFNTRIEKDVRRVLGIPKAKKIVHYHERKNLKLSSSELRSDSDLVDKVMEISGKMIVYCGTQKLCVKMAERLSRALGNEEVGFYHAGVNEKVKQQFQDRFAAKNQLRIICATNAFGMGVDIPDIEAVIHYMHPGDPEALEQESGRGGRDGRDCICHAFSSNSARSLQEMFLENGNPERRHFEQMFRAMRTSANAEGVFHKSCSDLAVLSGVSEGYYMAILQTLEGAKVIEKAPNMALDHIVELLADPKDGGNINQGDIHFARMHAFVRKHGCMVKEGYIVDLDQLAGQLNIQPGTARNYLNTWAREGLISYCPPPRAEPKRIIGELAQVDFERLAIRRVEAQEKYAYLLRYFDIPDQDKHAYMRDYFNSTAGA
jgi:RecQ family ATP-dependent DNA helicase